MSKVHYDTKHIQIRWHGLRNYQGVDVTGMRGFPNPNYDGGQRYELWFEDGEWECHYFLYDADGVIGYEPRFKLIKRDVDLYAVIRASEEHAFQVYEEAHKVYDPE